MSQPNTNKKKHFSYIRLATTSDSPEKYKKMWEDELNMHITDYQWEKASVFTHKCSLSTRLQEISYKICTQWYITPIKIKKWSPWECWRCNEKRGTFLHLWWNSTPIQSFWTQFKKWVIHITDTQIELNAAFCLLHINDLSYRKYENSLIRHLLNAAKFQLTGKQKISHQLRIGY